MTLFGCGSKIVRPNHVWLVEYRTDGFRILLRSKFGRKRLEISATKSRKRRAWRLKNEIENKYNIIYLCTPMLFK